MRLHMLITGRVQGVFFRQRLKEKAEELGLTGWVRNLSDARVEAMAEGQEYKLKELIEWSKTGPLTAEVEKVDFHWLKDKREFKDFSIIYEKL